MRFAIVLLASLAAGWLFHELNTLGTLIPRPVFAYLGWVCIGTLLAFFVVQRIPHSESGYTWFFAFALGPAILLALTLTLRFAIGLTMEGGVFLILGAIFLCASLVNLLSYFIGSNALHTRVMLLQGYIFSVCGIIALASLIPPRPLLGFLLRLGFGLYWLALGLFAFSASIGVTRNRRVWAEMNSWFPSTCAIVLLGGLAFFVHRSHAELSHQENPEAALHAGDAVEQVYAEAE